MREPRFWARDVDPKSREAAPLFRTLCTPAAWLYASVTRRKIQRTTPHQVDAKVICIGNLTAGGVGKSPVVAGLRKHIEAKYGLRVATLSRGYKGKLSGPLKVDPVHHTAADVGDEPFMLAQSGETWIGGDRAATGTAMNEDGVEIILMDDGHQNPGLHKDLSFIVVDSVAGFGNGYVIPKGPLREPILEGLSRAHAVITIGDGDAPAIIFDSDLPVFTARIAPTRKLNQDRYVAFAGIGRPEKFFDTLKSAGAQLEDAVPYPDHYTFKQSDLRYLRRLSVERNATLITTEKDFARLAVEDRRDFEVLPIEIQFDQLEALDKLIADVIKPGADAEN